jgi:hypothetical protein
MKCPIERKNEQLDGGISSVKETMMRNDDE